MALLVAFVLASMADGITHKTALTIVIRCPATLSAVLFSGAAWHKTVPKDFAWPFLTNSAAVPQLHYHSAGSLLEQWTAVVQPHYDEHMTPLLLVIVL